MMLSLPDPLAGLSRRPQQPEDLPFLAALLGTARALERSLFPGDQAMWDMLMAQQAAAQDHHYRTHYPGATFDILEEGDQPVGRLALCAMPVEVRVVDIALVPEVRGQGRGGEILRAVLHQAEAAGLPVRLHVDALNPARRLYERLGFVVVRGDAMHHFMERLPRGAVP